MCLKADFYEVQGAGRDWKAIIFQGSNIVEEIEAVSEKQAHFLAHEYYPEAKTPAKTHAELMKQWHSAEGYQWRARNRKVGQQNEG